MESLSGLHAFVTVGKLGSYVAAAERLAISASAVGKSVARLEDGLGVRLFNRSTRRLSLTEEGALFFERLQVQTGAVGSLAEDRKQGFDRRL